MKKSIDLFLYDGNFDVNELIAIAIVNMIAEKPTGSLNTVNIREIFLKLVK